MFNINRIEEIKILKELLKNNLQDISIDKDNILVINIKTVDKSLTKVFPFRTLTPDNTLIKYPTKFNSLIFDKVRLLSLFEDNLSTDIIKNDAEDISDTIDITSNTTGWFRCTNELTFINGEIFLKQYLNDVSISNVRKRGLYTIKEKELLFISVDKEKDDYRKFKIKILFNHLLSIIDSLKVNRTWILDTGDILYLLDNHNYLFIIPGLYICFCTGNIIQGMTENINGDIY